MNTNSTKLIAVCGATGHQGGEVVKSLLRIGGHRIVALTRNLESEQALSLKEQGAQLCQADLLDLRSLIKAFFGADAIFGVTQPWSPDYRHCFPEKEIQQGHNIIKACLANNVPRIVMSTVPYSKDAERISHARSKFEVEKYLRDSGLEFTLVRCAQFMENIGMGFFPIRSGKLHGFLDADARSPYVSCRDIGAIAAMALTRDTLLNQEVELVGDFISGQEICQMLTEIRGGERYTYKASSRFLMWLFAREFYQMRNTMEKLGKPPYPGNVSGSIAALKQIHPALLDMRNYLTISGFARRNFS